MRDFSSTTDRKTPILNSLPREATPNPQMQYLTLLLLLSFPLLALVSCLPYTAYVRYDIGLDEVDRPASAQERYGESVIDKREKDGVERYYFEDNLVQILWLVTTYKADFLLTNRTDHSIKIIWDEAAFIDLSGASHRVLHSGVRYLDKGSPQARSVVAKGASLSDVVIPADYVEWGYSRWVNKPLVSPATRSVQATADPERTRTGLAREARQRIGQQMRILLPIEIEGIVNEYTFTFSVRRVCRTACTLKASIPA